MPYFSSAGIVEGKVPTLKVAFGDV